MSTIRGVNFSLEEVSMLMGHMAQADRNHETRGLGADIKQAADDKKEMRKLIEKMQGEVGDKLEQMKREKAEDDEGIELSLDGAGEVLDDLNPFSGNDWEETQEKVQRQTIALEGRQVALTERQDQLEALRTDAKDVGESYETSKKIYESVAQELEAARMAPVQF